MQVAITISPLNGESYCGDAAAFWTIGSTTILAIVDGLGHGRHAQAAATAAIDYIAAHLNRPMADLFSGCSDAIRGTRGAAMAIASIEEQAGVLTYAGIGNTRAMVVGDRTIRLSSNYGIVGGSYRKLTLEKVPIAENDLVLLFTDGLKEIINVAQFGELPSIDLDSLAGEILRQWRLPGDDAAILVYRKETS